MSTQPVALVGTSASYFLTFYLAFIIERTTLLLVYVEKKYGDFNLRMVF